jgi:hypothetical protein
MNQSTSTVHSVGALGVGGALAVLILFAARVWSPEIYDQMGDLEKQAVTLLVAGLSQRVWSIFGPKGGMQ